MTLDISEETEPVDPEYCPEGGVWPDPVWAVDTPENHGMDSYN